MKQQNRTDRQQRLTDLQLQVLDWLRDGEPTSITGKVHFALVARGLLRSVPVDGRLAYQITDAGRDALSATEGRRS